MHAALLVAVALVSAPGGPQGSPPDSGLLTLPRLHGEPPLEGRPPTALGLSPRGTWLTWLSPSPGDSDVLDLVGARLPDGAPRTLVSASDLLAGAEQRLSEAERMALERRRITRRGLTSYQWCGDDGLTLLFPFSGDLYLARLAPEPPPPATGEPTPKCLPACGRPRITRLTSDPEAPELNPSCAPDGARVAYVKDGDLHVLDLSAPLASARRLTSRDRDTQTFGLPEFIAEEEMGRHEGFWWSPDGQRLLVLEVDEAPVSVKRRARIHAGHTDLMDQRYPAAGEANARVTPWLVEAAGAVGPGGTRVAGAASPVRLSLPASVSPDPAPDGYLTRAGFLPDGSPWLSWQSRDQRRLTLLVGRSTRPDGPGAEPDERPDLRPLLTEEDPAWVELHDDLRALPDGRLLWSTERSGRRQLVVVDRRTGRLTPLTSEPEPVHSVLAVDPVGGRVFYSAWRDRGRQLHVFSIPLRGGQARQLTREPGWHDATFDPSGRFFVDRHSDLFVPPQTRLRDARGAVVRDIDLNPADALRSFALPEVKALEVTAPDGTPLNAWFFRPLRPDGALGPGGTRSDGATFPVIASIYGGPGAQTVRRAWSRSLLHVLRWTQLGVGVLMLDNRGMAGRDRAFTRAHHLRFGQVEREDLHAGIAALSREPGVDPARIGLFGWSYGGFLAAREALDPASPFAATVSVAPVTDWTLYDTHYTERYLGLPRPDGRAGALSPTYADTDLVARARDLSRPLLLMHGTADDNVLFEHTLRLSEALQNAGRRFELMIYPGKAHGISGKTAQVHVYSTLTGFFARHLGFRDPDARGGTP
jgi:dipeptidyl-peptidase-4